MGYTRWVRASMSLKLQKNLSGSVFGRINSVNHFADCDKSLDTTIVDQRTFFYYSPGYGGFDPGSSGLMDAFRDTTCQSCEAHTIAYRESENHREMQAPAAFSVRENVKSHEELGPLADQIHEVVKSAFAQPNFDKADTLKHLSGDLFITAHQGEKLVGFSTAVYGSPSEVLKDQSLPIDQGVYLAAGAVAKESQSQGIYQAMLLQRIYVGLDKGVDLVYTRTQNPRVEQSIISAMKILKLSKDISDCTIERVKLPGFYGEMLTGEKPTTDDPKIQKIYTDLDARAGDAYVLLFRMMKGKK